MPSFRSAAVDRGRHGRSMKKNVKFLLYQRKKKVRWDNTEEVRVDALDKWPDLRSCIDVHYRTSPDITQYHDNAAEPATFSLNDGFMRSVDRYCTTKTMKLKLIDSMTKIIYRIPCSGLRDAPIKESPGLRHFYLSVSWRVFYRRTGDHFEFEELCPHKKLQYYR
jgi:hypothetical protein